MMKPTTNLIESEAHFVQKLYYAFGLLTVLALLVIPCAGLQAYWLYGHWPDGSYSNLQYLPIRWYQLIHAGLLILVIPAHFVNIGYLLAKLLAHRRAELSGLLFLLLGLVLFLSGMLIESVSFYYSYWFFDD